MLSHKLLIPLALLALCASLLPGCGTSSPSTPTPPPPSQIKVAITPSTTSSVINQTTQFTATVTGTSNTAVTWSVTETNGGTISAGLYKAPIVNGTYHVVATSVADSSKSASAAVAIAAPFLFIQDYKPGDALPFSMTPIVGAFGADTKFSANNLIDSGTGKPISSAIDDIFLSPDGTKGVASILAEDYSLENISVGDVTTGKITQLTNNTNAGQYSWKAQFTPDGKKVIYLYEGSETCGPEIWTMNADGSNQAPVYPNPRCSNDAYVSHPTVSPDGTKIAAYMERSIGQDYYEGIAIMNSDGSNVQQLTGGANESCPYAGSTFYWDENPSFTADGKQVVFSRHCDLPNPDVCQQSIYSINLETKAVIPLVTNSTGVYNLDPLIVGDKLVFSSDMDTAPENAGAYDMYSTKMDGTKIVDGAGLTRLTTNTLYDAFTTDEMWWESASRAAKTSAQKSSAQRRSLQVHRGTHPHRSY